MFTHDCVAKHDSNTTITFSDDTTVVGLSTDNDETFWQEVRDLAVWRQDNLYLNMNKTKELIVNDRKRKGEHAPSHIGGAVMDRVESFKFLDVQTIMFQTYQDSCEEGTTTPFPTQETEKIWHGSPDPQKVIQLHHGEHPADWLHHRLVWQLLGIRLYRG
jgi:hypothetical protein